MLSDYIQVYSYRKIMSKHKQWIVKLLIFQVCSIVMSDDSVKIEDRIFRQKRKVKFAQRWWKSSFLMVTSKSQSSKKNFEHNYENPNLKEAKRGRKIHHQCHHQCHHRRSWKQEIFWGYFLAPTPSWLMTNLSWLWRRAYLHFSRCFKWLYLY